MEWKAEDRRQVPLHGMFCDFNADWQTGGIMPEETVGQECMWVCVCRCAGETGRRSYPDARTRNGLGTLQLGH